MLDPLSTIMACIITFVSFLVHIYSIGYMTDDPGYQRFFQLHFIVYLCDVITSIGT